MRKSRFVRSQGKGEILLLRVRKFISFLMTRKNVNILHGRPPNNAHIAQIDSARNKGFLYLKGNIMNSLRIEKLSISTVASVALLDTFVSSNSFARVSHSSTLGLRAMDSDASDHIFG